MSKKTVSANVASGGSSRMAPVAKASRAGIVKAADGPLCGRMCSCRHRQRRVWFERWIMHVLHRPPTGRPQWLQPADAPSNHCALVATAASPGGRVLCCPPSGPRWHLSGSPERSVCGDGCNPLRRGICGPRNGRRPRSPAAVLYHPGPPRVNSFQCDRRWQPARDPDLARSVADDRHSTLAGPHPTSRPQLVSPFAETSRRPSTARLVSPRRGDPHCGRAGSVRRSGAGVGNPIRAAPGTPGRTRAGFQRSQTCPQYVTLSPCRTCFTISTIQ